MTAYCHFGELRLSIPAAARLNGARRNSGTRQQLVCLGFFALQSASIPFPTIDDFRADSLFDPNPHRLELAEDYLETSLFVQSLAVWGPSMLIRSAFACATLQVDHQSTCRLDLVAPRDAALDAVKTFIQSPTSGNCRFVKQASKHCAKLYGDYGDEPDSPDARTVWSHLGAPWFAAETAAQDFKLEDYDGPEPREASSTWCKRNAVWATCAADAAAEWSSHENVRAIIRTALLNWIANARD